MCFSFACISTGFDFVLSAMSVTPIPLALFVVVVGGVKQIYYLVKTLSVSETMTFCAKEIEKVYCGFLKKGSV